MNAELRVTRGNGGKMKRRMGDKRKMESEGGKQLTIFNSQCSIFKLFLMSFH